VRDHRLLVDQPSPVGHECGPTPVELFVASLAACAGYYAHRFLVEHAVASGGLRVECDWSMRAATPASVGSVRLRILAPGVPPGLENALLAAVDRCTVANSLKVPPRLVVELALTGDGAHAGAAA
jgi:uncharacterized OsmC-like protein